MLETLYKKTKKDQIQTWGIEVNNDKFRTYEGIINGAITYSEWTICVEKNIGKKNALTSKEQAQKQALAKWNMKIDKGYKVDINDIDNKTYFEPMLAAKYEDYKHTIIYPLFVQPKLDGIRCVAKANGLWSRNGKLIISCPHVYNILKPWFDQYPDTIFDGELYCDKLSNNFNQIVSLIKKQKVDDTDKNIIENTIQYWVYDLPSLQNNFGERIEKANFIIDHLQLSFLTDKKSKFFPLYKVDTQLVHTETELDLYYGKYLEDGYEGQIIRVNGMYENKRTSKLLKRKEFIDDEFEILDIEEGVGNRSHMAGYMICKLLNGNTFRSNIKGDYTFYKELLENKQLYIGKMATIRFQNLTPNGIPRFPRCITIRDYE